MRLLTLLVALALLAPAASAQQDSPVRKGIDQHQEPGFVAVAALIADSTFFERWEQPETPGLHPRTRYAQGETAYPIVVFQTDAVNEQGHADLTYDVTVTKPDGSPYGEGAYVGLPAWRGAPTRGLTLALAHIKIVIEADDPVGVYGVAVVLHDRVRGRSFPLSLAFEVAE